MERMQQRIRQIASGDQAKLARLKKILNWFDNEWDFEDGEGHVAMYAKERDGGDEGDDVLLSSSHATVLRFHRVSPLGNGADRFTRGDS